MVDPAVRAGAHPGVASGERDMERGGGMKKPNPCISVYGPGPDGARCKTCAHLDSHPGAGRIYWKCLLRAYSHGPGTDHRVNWPACGKWEEVADA